MDLAEAPSALRAAEAAAHLRASRSKSSRRPRPAMMTRFGGNFPEVW
jgi:hypothetical protein